MGILVARTSGLGGDHDGKRRGASCLPGPFNFPFLQESFCKLQVGKQQHNITLTDVLYIPGLSDDIVSVRQLSRKGVTTVFGVDGCQFADGEDGAVFREKL